MLFESGKSTQSVTMMRNCVLLNLLTSDVEGDRVALAVTLGVVGSASVHPAVGPHYLLQYQALVADNHLLLHVMYQLTAL